MRRVSDEGFTLVEVMIALVLLGIVAAASAPLVVSGLKATQVARYNTQAKNLLQQRIDVLRNLQYHVPSTSGTYVDLLDTYFRDIAATTNSRCTSQAYYATTTTLSSPARTYSAGTYVCTDPKVPVRATSTDLPPGFHEEVASRFVDPSGTTVMPSTGTTSPQYDSQTAAGEVPPASTLAMTVTVRWTSNGVAKSYSSSTYRSDLNAALPLAVSHLRTNAYSVDTTVDDLPTPTTQHLAAGVVSADTSLAVGATARAVVQGAVASYSTGETTAGQATGSLDAPDDQASFTAVTGTTSTGVPCGTTACFGPTRASGVTGSANAGLPQVASATAPLTSSLTRGSTPMIVSNVPTGAVQARLTALGVQSSASPPTAAAPTPLVRQVQGSGNGYTAACDVDGTSTGGVDFATGTGFVQSTAGAAHAVTACTTATTQTIDVLPTTFAPQGVLRVTLDYASLRCTSGVNPAATANYQARVSYWTGSAYSPDVVLKNGSATTFPTSLLTRGPGGVQVWTNPSSGAAVYLGDYFTGLAGPSLATDTTAPTAKEDLKVFTLSTVPTRDADTTGASAVNLTVGELGCYAQDNR